MYKKYLFVSDHDEFYWSDIIVRKSGVCLERYEVEILKMIYIHKIVTASMVHDMYLLNKESANKNAITNRIHRLVKKKILYQKKQENITQTIPISYFYCLGLRGFNLLKRLELPNLQIKKRNYEPSKIRIPNLHNAYAINTVQQLFLANQKRDHPYAFSIVRGDAHIQFKRINENVFMRRNSINKVAAIIPDYVITLDNIIICLESDMSTERVHRIQQKEEMYCQLKQSEEFKDKSMFVVYSLVEKSSKNGNNHLSSARRIHSLKKSHSPARNWPEGLEFYVVSSNEVVEFILDLLLSKTYPLPIPLKSAVQTTISNKHRNFYEEKHGWQNAEIEMKDLLVDRRQLAILPPEIYPVKFFSLFGNMKTIVYLTGEFGSVRTYQELRTLNKVLAVSNSTIFLKDHLPIEIVVCYLKSVNLTREYFGFVPLLSIRLMDYEDKQNRELKLVTAYKKVWQN